MFPDRVTQIPIAQARPDDRALCARVDLPQSETPRMQSRRRRRGRRTAGHVWCSGSRMGMQRTRLQDVVLDRHLCRRSYAIRPSGRSTSRHDDRQRPIVRRGRRYLQSKSLRDFRMKNRMRQNSVGLRNPSPSIALVDCRRSSRSPCMAATVRWRVSACNERGTRVCLIWRISQDEFESV
jgi:hypothetical protein